MTRILVIGGAGFIGSHVIETLLDNFYDVTVYDNFSSPQTDVDDMNLRDTVVIEGDIMDVVKLTAATRCCDAVIHLAAKVDVSNGSKDPLADVDATLKGTINVIHACVTSGVKRIINASSAYVYGDELRNPSKETDKTEPSVECGITKLAAEKYFEIARKDHGLDYTTLRISTAYGPNEWFGRAFPVFVKRALCGEPLVVFGNGKQQRDFVHVKDVSSFIVGIIRDKKTFGKVYNVSSGIGTEIRELATKINDMFNVGIIYEYIDEGKESELVEGRVRTIRDQKHVVLDNALAQKDTLWRPKIDLDAGILDTVCWAKLNHEAKWNDFRL